MDRTERIQQIAGIVAAKGWKHEFDKDGDIVFMVDDLNYVVMVEEGDPDIAIIALANFWSIGSNDELALAREAADFVNGRTKLVKIFTRPEDGKDVIAFIPLTGSIENIGAFFELAVSELRVCVYRFGEKMTELALRESYKRAGSKGATAWIN